MVETSVNRSRAQLAGRMLLMSTPVGPLGSGIGGGVELTLQNLVRCLSLRGYEVDVVAPEGSVSLGDSLYQVPGNWQSQAQLEATDLSTIQLPLNAVLANMWQLAYEMRSHYDLVINFAYDWLPLYLTPFFDRPIAHWISMSCLSSMMDEMVGKVAIAFPGTIAVNSRASANTFQCGEQLLALGKGIDLSLYTYVPQAPTRSLAWVGRISPEKGLEDAVAASAALNIPLKIFGLIQDQVYWQGIQTQYPDAPIEYLGFLPTPDLQAALGQCQGLLMTPRWEEAFGNVTIEALACGVPVIAYRRGGLVEIINHGKTGYLVEPDQVSGLIAAITQLEAIDRQACRRAVETHYSLEAWGDRMASWLQSVIASKRS